VKFSDKVYKLCKQIPSGKISTYREIGKKLNSKAFRAIGQALKRNPAPIITPCHRVVRTNGDIGGFSGETSGPKIQKKISLLEKEGVQVKDDKIVNFERVLHRF
jgi:methylated-DNA-[protein]-cysteine S-methyltransferase